MLGRGIDANRTGAGQACHVLDLGRRGVERHVDADRRAHADLGRSLVRAGLHIRGRTDGAGGAVLGFHRDGTASAGNLGAQSAGILVALQCGSSLRAQHANGQRTRDAHVAGTGTTLGLGTEGAGRTGLGHGRDGHAPGQDIGAVSDGRKVAHLGKIDRQADADADRAASGAAIALGPGLVVVHTAHFQCTGRGTHIASGGDGSARGALQVADTEGSGYLDAAFGGLRGVLIPGQVLFTLARAAAVLLRTLGRRLGVGNHAVAALALDQDASAGSHDRLPVDQRRSRAPDHADRNRGTRGAAAGSRCIGYRRGGDRVAGRHRQLS